MRLVVALALMVGCVADDVAPIDVAPCASFLRWRTWSTTGELPFVDAISDRTEIRRTPFLLLWEDTMPIDEGPLMLLPQPMALHDATDQVRPGTALILDQDMCQWTDAVR